MEGYFSVPGLTDKQNTASRFWLANGAFTADSVMFAVVWYYLHQWTQATGIDLFITAFAFILAVAALIYNRRSPRWKEYRGHIDEAKSAGWNGAGFGGSICCFMPNAYAAIPRRIPGWGFMISLIEVSFLAWLAAFLRALLVYYDIHFLDWIGLGFYIALFGSFAVNWAIALYMARVQGR